MYEYTIKYEDLKLYTDGYMLTSLFTFLQNI